MKKLSLFGLLFIVNGICSYSSHTTPALQEVITDPSICDTMTFSCSAADITAADGVVARELTTIEFRVHPMTTRKQFTYITSLISQSSSLVRLKCELGDEHIGVFRMAVPWESKLKSLMIIWNGSSTMFFLELILILKKCIHLEEINVILKEEIPFERLMSSVKEVGFDGIMRRMIKVFMSIRYSNGNIHGFSNSKEFADYEKRKADFRRWVRSVMDRRALKMGGC